MKKYLLAFGILCLTGPVYAQFGGINGFQSQWFLSGTKLRANVGTVDGVCDRSGSNCLVFGVVSITAVVDDTTPQLGGNLDAQTFDITNVGSLGATGARLTKGWFTDLEVTNAIAGSITGNAGTVTTITGLAPDTATTAAAQPNITSLGTLTTLTIDDITINANSITSAGASSLSITPTAGQAILLDSTISIDAGDVTGVDSIDATGAVDMDYGSADITDHTFVSDGGTVIIDGSINAGAGDITNVGSLGATGARLTKGWFTDLEVTNDITISGTALASVYAPLSNPIFTGTGITVGISAVGVDYTLTFDGENSNGVITWDEDNAKFNFGAADIATTGNIAAGSISISGASNGNFVVENASPAYIWKDTDGTDADDNGQILGALTDIGTGTEDFDMTFSQQIAGAMTPWLTSDADGSIAFGTGRTVAATTFSGSGASLTSIPYTALATGTAGNLITWDAGGSIAVVSTGTSGQVLTSNGAGTAPTFQAAAGGSVATTVQVKRTSAQSIGTASFVAVQFDTEETDTNGEFSTSTFTASGAGLRRFDFNIVSAAISSAHTTFYEIRVNGTSVAGWTQYGVISQAETNSYSIYLNLSGGDTVALYAQANANTTNINGNSDSFKYDQSRLQVTKF